MVGRYVLFTMQKCKGLVQIPSTRENNSNRAFDGTTVNVSIANTFYLALFVPPKTNQNTKTETYVIIIHHHTKVIRIVSHLPLGGGGGGGGRKRDKILSSDPVKIDNKYFEIFNSDPVKIDNQYIEIFSSDPVKAENQYIEIFHMTSPKAVLPVPAGGKPAARKY